MEDGANMEEVSATTAGSGETCLTKAAAEAGAANNNTAVAEAGKVKPAFGKKRTKTVRAKQEYIDALLERYPFEPYPWDPEVIEKTMPDPAKRAIAFAPFAPTAALMKEIRDKEEAIVKQYLAQGYAEEEVEVSDDDEEA
ncbi:unnamed protein product [Urochloa humidicola]